jgi:hypothetical protein
MAKSISVDKKRRGRGRPATGHDPALSARVPKDVLAAVDQWAAGNECTRSEAVAVLLEHGLAAMTKNPADTPRDLKLLAKVSAWAKAHKMTVSEALPTLVEQALAAAPATVPRKPKAGK